MSTRACYRFIPENGPNDWPGVITVYKHHDGYPSGAAEAIENALAVAWPLPRYEADEFAAAFVAANKQPGGGVRLVPFEGLDAHKRFASDTEYLYDIRCVGGKIQVTAYTTCERDGEWTIEKFFKGSMKQLARRKP
jgi:hypothetical protein